MMNTAKTEAGSVLLLVRCTGCRRVVPIVDGAVKNHLTAKNSLTWCRESGREAGKEVR